MLVSVANSQCALSGVQRSLSALMTRVLKCVCDGETHLVAV